MLSVETPARTELGRFFEVSARQFASDQPVPEMFSAAVDAEWHRLLNDPGYAAFCAEHAGRPVRHVENSGFGRISWVDAYEEMFGQLPQVWFTDADGVLNERAFTRYRETGEVWAEWDCTPLPSDDVVPSVAG
ncbi:hypothetical protein ACSCBZ_41385 [Streptomyces niveiscabiei]|uniref:hypothetical protein n=1 Tax=Streptomyces niveiscabiei TaxID=164115 RepID=UPI000AF0DA3D|nr:hypothetical protein [Streptomyces niveiscabiei]